MTQPKRREPTTRVAPKNQISAPLAAPVSQQKYLATNKVTVGGMKGLESDASVQQQRPTSAPMASSKKRDLDPNGPTSQPHQPSKK